MLPIVYRNKFTSISRGESYSKVLVRSFNRIKGPLNGMIHCDGTVCVNDGERM